MRFSKRFTATIVITATLFGGGLFLHNQQMNNLFDKTSSTKFDIKTDSLEEILDKTDTFEVQKQIFSLNKHYFVLVDDVVVAEITGKLFPLFGDTLTVTDANNKIVKIENQIKRLGPTHGELFNISFSRLAEIKDASGNITGYIGEQKLKDLFNLNHIQYFMDSNKNIIGKGKQDFFLFCKDFTIKDSNNKTVYKIDGNILSLSSKSTITKTNDSDIDEIDVILYDIIENSIISSKSSSSSKSKKSK